MQDITTTTYRLAAELRRSCVYGIAGALLVCVVGYVVYPDRSPIFVWIVFGALALALLLPLSWRLLVSDRGVERRIASWRDFWSWEDFASGRIEKWYPIVMVDPERPWWRRRLNLGHVGGEACKELIDLVNQHYQLPPPPEVPEALDLKIGFSRVHLDAHSVRWETRRAVRQYHWNDVRRIRIVRPDPLRRDFRSLVLEFPDGDVKLEVHIVNLGQVVDGWRGAPADVLNEFVHAHLPADRIDVDIAGRLPVRRTDVERELKIALRNARAMNWFAYLLVVVMAFCTWLWIADLGVVRGLIQGAVMSAIVTLYPGTFIWFMRREWRRKAAQLREKLSGFNSVDSHPLMIEQRSIV